MINTLLWKDSAVKSMREFYKEAVLEIGRLPISNADIASLRTLLQKVIHEDFFPEFSYRIPVAGGDREAGVRISVHWNEANRKNCRITFATGYGLLSGLDAAGTARYAGLIKQVADVAAKLEMLAVATIDAAPYDKDQVRAAEEKWSAQRQREHLTPGARKVLDRILKVASGGGRDLSTDTNIVVELSGVEKRSVQRLNYFLTYDNTRGFETVNLLAPGLHLARAEENTDA